MKTEINYPELDSHWLERDALVFPQFKFQEIHRNALLGALPKLPTNEQNKIITALEGCISNYKAWRKFEDKNTPGRKTHQQLNRLTKAINRLNVAMLELDWGTPRAIAPYFYNKKKPSVPMHSLRKPDEMDALDKMACAAHNLSLIHI
jgi:hypothetical protein